MDETTPVASSERIAEDEPRRTDDRRVRRSSRSRSPRVGGSSSGAPRRRSRSPPPRRRPSRERRRRSRSRSRDYRRDGGHRRGGGGGRSRSRSRDRYRRRRSPSPEVPPISQWPRKLNNWDFQPPGYEHLTAQQAKMSGLFPVPGGSFRPTGAAAVTGVTTGGVPRRTDSGAQSAAGLGLPTSAVMAPRTQRRVYLGNLPPGVNDRILVDWLNNLLQTNNSVKYAGNPCININVNYDRNFAFAEFRDADEAGMCCLLDGAALNGHSVRLRRPKDYVFDPNLADSKERPASETTGGGGANGPNTIFIGNLPPNLAEPQIRELLETFGPLKIFKMIRDSMGASRGFGFVEYVNPEVTDAVIQGLNGMELGDRKIAVQHAQQDADGRRVVRDDAFIAPIFPLSLAAGMAGAPQEPTAVLQLLNIVTDADLVDPGVVSGLKEDVRRECEQFGPIEEVEIPALGALGQGRTFVRFSSADHAVAAAHALSGRRFADRIVAATYCPLPMFEQRAFLFGGAPAAGLGLAQPAH